MPTLVHNQINCDKHKNPSENINAPTNDKSTIVKHAHIHIHTQTHHIKRKKDEKHSGIHSLKHKENGHKIYC